MIFQLVEEIEAKPSSDTTPEETIMNAVLNDLKDRFVFLKKNAMNLETKINSTNTMVSLIQKRIKN